MYSVVGSDGQVYGPVDTETLRQWIAEGRILPTTNLVDPLDGRMIQAQHAPVLMGTFPDPYLTPQAPHPQAHAYPRPDLAAYGPPKSKVAALVIAFFLGNLGIHRFYLGHTSSGIAMLALFGAGFFTCGIAHIALAVWWLVDLILIATGALCEPNGRALE